MIRFFQNGMTKKMNGVQLIAVIEGIKGLVVLLAGFGLLSLVHHNVQEIIEALITRLQLNPSGKYPHIFLHLMENMSDRHLWLLAGLAFAYATVRFIEAYGLWRTRPWAEWFAAVSGAIYLPIEVYELCNGANLIKVCVLLINLCVVGYVAYALWQTPYNRH